jgi:transcription initiation factor IIE alpha subunit
MQDKIQTYFIEDELNIPELVSSRKVKSILRKFTPRTLVNFKKAIKKAYTSISTNDLFGWFRHYGYAV